MGSWGAGFFQNDTACDFEIDVRKILETINTNVDGFLEQTLSIFCSTEDLRDGVKWTDEELLYGIFWTKTMQNINLYVKSLIEQNEDEKLREGAINFKYFEAYKKFVFELLELKGDSVLLIERILKEYLNSRLRNYGGNHYSFAASELQLEIGRITPYVKENVLHWVGKEKIDWFRNSDRIEREKILNELKEKVLTS